MRDELIKQMMIYEGSIEKWSMPQLLSCHHWDEYVARFITYLSEYYSQEVEGFLTLIESLKATHQLSSRIKLLLLKNHFDDKKLSDANICIKFNLIGLLIKVKDKLGESILSQLLSLKAKSASVDRIKCYAKICLLLLFLPEEGVSKVIEKQIPLDLDNLISDLSVENKKLTDAQFLKTSSEKIFLKNTDENDELIRELNSIKGVCGDWNSVLFSPSMIEFVCRNNRIATLSLIALHLKRHRGVFPYDEQFMAVILLLKTPEKLKGRLEQIKTGEGKSIVVAMLAAYLALKGRRVDIITSADYLAKRDCDEDKAFFTSLGISSGHICVPSSDEKRFESQIIFGTNTDFRFAYLRARLSGKPYKRGFDAVIVDEVDGLMLDESRNSARIAMRLNENHNWLYEPILEFVRTHCCEDKKIDFIEFHTRLVHQLKHYLTKYNKKIVSDKKLFKLVSHAHDALWKMKKGVHYDVELIAHPMGDEQPQVVIYSHDSTGRKHTQSRWGEGLHQFLEVLNNIEPKEEDATPASFSLVNFFMKYQCIYGVTGTLGSQKEQEELNISHRVDALDIPKHLPSVREMYKPDIAHDDATHSVLIKASIVKLLALNRPILVIFKSIKEVEDFCQYLQKFSMPYQKLTGKEGENEGAIITQAGREKRVTITTNIAGRGTDIKLTPGSVKNGGLHVIFTYFPSHRVQEQGFGRSNRQGQPGSGEFILNAKNELGKEYNKNRSDADTLALLELLRHKQAEEESIARVHGEKIEAIKFRLLEGFFSRLETLYHVFEEEHFLKFLHHIAKIFINDEGGGDLIHKIDQSLEAHRLWLKESGKFSKKPPSLDKFVLKLSFENLHPFNDFKMNTKSPDKLIQEFKKHCIHYFKIRWAEFYGDLDEFSGCSNLSFMEDSLNQRHPFVIKILDRFQGPENIFYWLIHGLTANKRAMLTNFLQPLPFMSHAKLDCHQLLFSSRKRQPMKPLDPFFDKPPETLDPMSDEAYFTRHPIAKSGEAGSCPANRQLVRGIFPSLAVIVSPTPLG
ncbi:MAG: hypothetical protein HY939_02590 [Gammaproteobacteria bacterium]|nr:hypothetical protein [Gammaproteobacteria bacterium]